MTTLKLTEIKTDGGTQTRAEIDHTLALHYGARMEAGDEFPPITVFYDGEQYWLADGFHRVEGATRFNINELAASVHQGTQRNAILYSVQANALHGKRRTNEDKARAILKLLMDDEWRAWSDREIARRTKTSHPHVARLRAANFPDEDTTERTYTRDGKTRTMDTGNISSSNAARATDISKYRPIIIEILRSGGNLNLEQITDKLIEQLDGDTPERFSTDIRFKALDQMCADGEIDSYIQPGLSGGLHYFLDRSDLPFPIEERATPPDYPSLILTDLESGPQRRVEILRSVRETLGEQFDHTEFTACFDRLWDSGITQRSGGNGEVVTYELAAATNNPFESLCESILTALGPDELTEEGLRLTVKVKLDDLELFDRAIKFQMAAQRIARRKDNDYKWVYFCADPTPPKPPVTPGNIEKFEQAKTDGTATYNGIPYPKTTTGGTPPMSLDVAKECVIDVFNNQRHRNRAFYPREIWRWSGVRGLTIDLTKQALESLANNPPSGIRTVQTKTGLAYADFDTIIPDDQLDAISQLDDIEQTVKDIFARLQNIDSMDFTNGAIKQGNPRAQLGRIKSGLTYASNELARLDVICSQSERAAQDKIAARAQVANAAS